ncbi:MAG: 2-succinyl-5-enolpyruvyl-6-hydroxy-3-cyclohexene-1-carboxylic-acid synthase [Actinobacteria bacterium]|nr:2-succinyl-5-enolpyruvyl-6-hydroxy-3-cyclohexene-1-carboxylic-acid synthase [Actinomycetota bacterium]MCG2800638.1 2-succinyl-5-enolpyruvyl-6-hydroxy-3-cyclohexene-1-carboxylic-acid synthase [Cellulomonas sp.]
MTRPADERAPEPSNPSTNAARALVQALVALGVRDVVLCPGSRSAPLALALADAAGAEPPADAPRVRLHVRIDERSAAFLALGLARAAEESGELRPVAVVTTSGTAVANLHPAVLEAHHSGVPLLLLTADRPHELRGVGANQTTDQPAMFGPASRLTVDVPAPSGLPGELRDVRQLASRAVAAATGARTGAPGPVHLNLAYRPPLVPTTAPWPEPSTEGLSAVTPRGSFAPDATPYPVAGGVRHARHQPTVLLAGDGAGPLARRVAEANSWPLLAEPSSGARGGPNAIAAYRVLLELAELGGAVRRVVVLGRPTLARPVQRLLARDDVEVVVVAPRGRDWTDAGRVAAQVLTEVPTRMRSGRPSAADASWLRAWAAADDAAGQAIDEVLDHAEEARRRQRRFRSAPRITGPYLARAVARASLPEDVLVMGASSPIRDLDLVARWQEPPLVLANRGLAGIDGTTSTAAGVALGLPGRRVRALVGDLTFLHDVGGLFVGPAEEVPTLQVVVANDQGGSIFTTLESGEPEFAHSFERVFATPHTVDLGALAEAYGVHHRLVQEAEELDPALAAPAPGLSVVEVRVDRTGRRDLALALATRTVEAIGSLVD